MSASDSNCSRREFLKAVTVVGAGAMIGDVALGQSAATAPATSTAPAAMGRMPTRVFGKSGVKVPILTVGGIFDILNNQVVLHQALRWGVTYWDTANSYTGGKSETGIGNFLGSNPQRRKDIFLVTKSSHREAPGLDEHLATSLERMKTDYVDMFFIHSLKGPTELQQHGAAWKDWAARQKDAGKIRLFGFSAHTRMAQSLAEAAKCDFIDGIMMTYNFRIMNQEQMKAAIEACHQAGIGLTAMKVMAKTVKEAPAPEELAAVNQFISKGYTMEQACLKVVWQNPAIASICTLMNNLTLLQADVQAATDGVKLSADDRRLLDQYARATCGGYCTACAGCQERAGDLPISDVMRWLMYAGAYGDLARARREFAQLPPDVRERLREADYWRAQAACPSGLPIAELMTKACADLG